jgi:hypothetical protein
VKVTLLIITPIIIMAALSNPPNLSQADEQILAQVFDPESSPDTPQIKIDPSLPADIHIADPAILKSLKKRELEAIQLVESYSTTSTSRPSVIHTTTSTPDDELAKDQVYNQALELLESLITEYPSYASAYNNRAQLRRWRYGEKALLDSSRGSPAGESLDLALHDLDAAIRLGSPSSSVGNTAVSPTQAKLLSQAWTQKGAIFWGLGRRSGTGSSNSSEKSGTQAESEWRTWDKMRLEEEGSKCFFMAGLYGSEMGRTMAVKANPYARLCGGIVREAMRREGTVS